MKTLHTIFTNFAKRNMASLRLLLVMLLTLTVSANAWGADVVYKTAKFGSSYNSTKVSSYTSSWYSTYNGFRVDIVNANNNQNGWSYIKMGSKSAASTGTITTNAKIDAAITKVSLTIDAITVNNITSITLKTATSSNGTYTSVGTFTKATGTQTVTLASPTANLFYKIEVVCTKGSSNGLIQISQVDYYKSDVVATPEYNITYVGDEHITYTSTKPETIQVDDQGFELEFSVNDGYQLNDVQVKMGGQDLVLDEDYLWEEGYLLILPETDITGDIEITFVTVSTCTTNPTVSAGSHSNVTTTTATVSCSGGITSLGSAGCSIESYGFVYGTSSNPTISNTKVQVGTTYTTTGTAFSKGLTGLTANTTYYVRPYATNGNGTAYGTQTTFKTLELPKYTVTLNAGSGTCVASVTEASAGAGVTLPTPTLDCGEWSFAGWAEASVGTETTTKPTLIAAGTYKPASNITLYAVYQRTEETEGNGGTENVSSSYTFSNFTAGTQYAENEVHKLDDVLTLTTTQCHFTSELRIYSSDAHNGYVVSNQLPGRIVSIGFNAGNKVDAIDVYGSTNGTAWTKVGQVSVTSTSYKDYALSFGENNYTYFKLDVAGANQVRLKSMTITWESTTAGGPTTTTYYHSVPDCATETAVTLDPNGGTISDDKWTLENGVYKLTTEDESITLPTITRTGYTFGGWATPSGGSYDANDIIPLDGNPVTLDAIWTANKYSITYKDQGDDVAFSGTHEDDYPTQHTYGIETTLKGATKIGYTFEGWHTDATCTNKVTTLGATEYTGAITLYAKWTAKALTNYRTDCDACNLLTGFASISGTYHFFPGETITMTVTPPEDVVPYTYQWQKLVVSEWDDLEGATTTTYTKTEATIEDVGHYRCVVSAEGYCDAIAEYNVKCLQLNVYYNDHTLAFTTPLERVDATTAIKSVNLENANYQYYFEITDGCENFYGFNGYIHSGWYENVELNAMNSSTHCGLQTTKFGTYIFTVDHSYLTDDNKSYPVVTVTYPSALQEANKVIYLDNDVLKWTNSDNAEGKNKIYYRIGHENHNSKTAMTLVPGTANLYKVTTSEYNNFEVWHIANNGCWSEGNPIYRTETGDDWAATQATAFETLPVTLESVTVTPTTSIGNGGEDRNSNCEFFNYDITEGMKTWNAEVIEPTNGTITVEYTHHDGTVVNNFTSGNRDLAHTCLLTITATADEGYSLASLTVNDVPFTSGNTHTLTEDAVIEAEFTINTHTVTWKPAGGNWSGDANDIVQTYEYDELIEAPEEPVRTGYEFVEWTPAYASNMTMPDEDLEFTAQWQINQYTVTLNPNYPDEKTGTFTYEEGELVDGNLVLTYDYNTASMTIEDLYTSLTLDGYDFGGWYNAKGVNPGEVSGSKCTTTGTITGNKTYFAKWTKLYSITLSENGTTTTPTTQTSTSYTLPTELSVGTCENDEKELVGWSTVAIPNPGDKPTSNFYELGETVTLTADQTTFYAVFATAEGGGTENVEATLSFADKAQRTSYSTSKQVWEQNGITLTNDKASSTSNVGDYADPARFYKSSNITIEAPGNITQIEFNCVSGYVISVTGATTSGTTVTVTLDGTSDTYTIMSLSAQVRLNSVVVNYTTDSGTSYSDYSTVCEAIPDPVLSFETEPANPIVFTDAVCGGNSSKQSVTVVGENLRDVVEVSVTGPYKIARTASTALKDFTTSLTLDKTAAGAIHSNYKTVYIISTPPAQSTEATTGTLTFTTTKGNTLTVNLSTPTVTCTQYTLTLVDRGVSTEQPTKYYAGETIDEAPADPEGVCTDPIHYVFDGWAETTVAAGATTYTKVTFPYTVEGNTKFYAVYRYVEDGGADSGDYVKVTENLDDYSGDYLFVYETGNVAFDGGRNNVDDELDATSNTIEVTIDNNTIASNATTDAAKFTIAKVDGGYSIQSASGYYIGRSATSNGLSTNETYSANYDLNTITDCKTIKGKGGTILKYNKAADQKRFRYYQSGQEDIALYRKAASYLYTTSPVCGPHLAITEGKDIYVTGGNAGGTRDLVIAQQKVSYKATRLQTSNGLVDGTAPDVKVATNGITVGGVVTSDVKVTIDQTKEQQTDGTYTITGTITVQYQPSANNKQEDIQVQLAVDYNAEARDNFTVHARSLPAEFVIVAKSGDKWYALNGDMNTNAANPANGQVTLDNDDNPTKATYAPCNTIYTFDGLPNTGDRTYVRFQGTDGAWLWASSGTNVGIQNNVLKTTPEGNNNAYNWKLYTENNITYRFGNANSSRQLTLSGEKFGMYASGVQDIRILPYVEKCLYNYAPSNLKVSVLKGTYVTLTWDAVAGATKYQYSTNGTTWTDAGTEPTVTINGLIGDTEYTYYIRAYHEDAGVTNECIDYAEITFTTANCDDVPTNITYTADLNSITVSWTAAAPTATITYNTKEDGTGGGGIINNATSPWRISGGLDKNTTYYIQILADGTCASPIIPVKTEDVEVDIVEWDPQGIIVDINTDETIGVTLENEVSYGSGLGSLAEDLFFSKYFEGSGSLKMIAIYNGTGKDVDLSEYRIDRGSNGDATNISKTYDLSQLGIIKQGQEIIFYSWPLISEYSYSCSQSFLDSKVQESGLDANPRWILCDAKTHNDIEFEAMDFSGNDPLLLYKSSELIDVFGVSTEQESPASTQICSGRSDQAWSADGVTNMDYGKTIEDFPNGEIPHGVNVDDETITAYTARVIMFRKNTVVSGKNAVTKNTTTFATFAEEWEARQVCMSGDDGDLTCAAYQELGTFDYSDYYTKYESMGEGTTFEENDRNPDGTVTIPITDLYKHACSNIRVKLTNSNGDVLTDREYKVPIMITTTQGTDGQTFLDLQENLATKEVDGEGNVIDTHPLTLDEVREICKTCDVVVRDNATLTKVTDGTTNDHPQVHDVIVYEGASIVIPDGTNHNYTINSLALRRKGDEVASAQVQGTGKFVLPADVPVTLSMRIDANNWHWFTLPYDCDIAKVTWSDGTPAKYNTDWFLMYYDGESRAASTNPYDNHWKVYSGTTIEAGKGYIIGITGNLAHSNYTFELCFPMEQDVLTAEQINKTVALNAWGVKSDNTPNNLGWNLVGNPYLNYYQPKTTGFSGLSLLQYTGIDPVTGDRLYDDSGKIPYLVTPIDGGWYEYRQDLASDVQMMPFTAYFVQVGDPATHENGQALDASFEASNRGKKSILRRAPSEVDDLEEPAIVAISLTNAKGESDKTTLIIDDRFTNEYEMNGDFFKWFGDYYRRYTKPVLYSMGADQGKRAFNALSEQLAAQPVALGMFAAQAGDYTFSLTRKRCDLSRVEEVWLYDATTATYTNLMQQDYTFTTAKTEGEGRFYLSVKMRQNAPTDITDIYGGNIVASAKDGQIIVGGLTDNTQLWIYDATGKLLHTEHTTNFQHVYDVPVVGTYFVRTQGAGQSQTIKVLVE